MAAMLVCELAQAEAAKGRTLLDLLADLYARYGYMGTRLLSFDIAGADPMAEMQRTMKNMRVAPHVTVGGELVAEIIDYASGVAGLPPSDVLTFKTKTGKAIVRPSGTEPKVKVYLSALGTAQNETVLALDAMEADANGWLGR